MPENDTLPADNSAAGILDIDLPAEPKDEAQLESSDATPETTEPAGEVPADTVPAGDGSASAVSEPVETVESDVAASRQQVSVAPDATDKKFDAALAAIEADEMLSPGQKAAETLRLETLREERNERRQRNATADDDRSWSIAAQEHGLPRKTLEPIWRDLTKEYAKKYPGVDPSRYEIAMNEKFTAIVASKKTAPPTVPAPPTRHTNRTPAAPPVGSVSPAAPSRNRPPAPSKDPGAEFDKSMTRDDLNVLV